MASYRIEWKRSAEKDLRSLDLSRIPSIIKAVDSLAQDPFPAQARKILGTKHQYRIRVGDYRVIYQADAKAGLIIIFHVRHRREAYRR